jgi:zinc finger protein 830
MSDVRALLRNERASRRVTHPNATYSTSGQLSCSLCYLPIKTEAMWDSHVRSAGHVNAQKQAQKAASGPSNRKRKATEEQTHSRKKSRNDGSPEDAPEFEETDADVAGPELPAEDLEQQEPEADAEATVAMPPPPKPTAQNDIDEDEWAAFERDVATPPPDLRPPPEIVANAKIVAKPVTAEELRLQAQEAAASNRELREAEVEGEREDATRALEDEFDEMEALEQRVRRLREQREALRQGSGPVSGIEPVAGKVQAAAPEQELPPGGESRDEDDDEEDEWSMWRT